MNNGQKSLSINETFIIEAENDGTMSACTGFFTNALVSCTGNTQILLGTNIIQANSAFSATTFYGDGSNLTGISTQDTFVTGGTYSAGTAVFTNNTGGTFSVTGFSTTTGNFVPYTGATADVNLGLRDLYVKRIFASEGISADDGSGSLSDLYSGYIAIYPSDGGYITNFGATFLSIGDNFGNVLHLEPSIIQIEDSNIQTQFYNYGIFKNNLLTSVDNTFNYPNKPSGYTGTFSMLDDILYVTGGTYSAGTAVFTNNTGGTFSVTGFTTPFTGGTIAGLTATTISATTISATTYQNLPLDIRVTGATKSGTVATFTNNTGGTFTLTGLTDVFVTGGTHSLATGTTTFRNSTGGTFNVSGYFKPSDDIYVTSGNFNNGPSINDNNLILNRTDASTVTIQDLVNISNTNKSEIDDLIRDKRIIRGKTYKISNCDSALYLNGFVNGKPTYTTIYLMGLEDNKLSETGIGIFYTPKYSDFQIFVNENSYNENDRVIWGGFVWECTVGGSYSSVDLFNLDTNGFSIIYPINDSGNSNSDLYNTQYDDIIYDYENDTIIYRNEQDSNIVQTNYSNIQYWVNSFNYNPIKVFQWGNVYDINNDRGIGNQRIINSYNENINFNGKYQINIYFDNLSYQRRLITNGSGDANQSNFILTNESYIDRVTLHDNAYQKHIYLNNESNFNAVEIYPNAYQSYITLDNFSYFLDITLEQGCVQNHLNFNNGSYQQTIVLINDGDIARQEFFNFTNESSQVGVSIQGAAQRYFNFNSGNQNNSYLERNQVDINIENGSQTNVYVLQSNITIKGYDLDWSSYPSVAPQTNLFFINDLPTEKTSRLIGKKENRLVEVSDFYYDGSKWVLTGDISINGVSATTLSATTYQNLPSINLDGLSDVTISTGITSGDTLMYNGSIWTNVNPFDYFDAKPIIYQKHVNMPIFGNAGINNVEGVSITLGGATARAFDNTNIVTRTQRTGLVTSTTGNAAQIRQTTTYFNRQGGFDLVTGFNMAENANDVVRAFIGVCTNTGAFGNTEPNTLLNVVGFCRLSTSNNIHLVYNDNTGTGTTVDLGVNFPGNTISTDKYLVYIKSLPTGIYVKIERVGTAFSYEDILTTDIPSLTTTLNFGMYVVDVTGASVATGIDWYGTYIKI